MLVSVLISVATLELARDTNSQALAAALGKAQESLESAPKKMFELGLARLNLKSAFSTLENPHHRMLQSDDSLSYESVQLLCSTGGMAAVLAMAGDDLGGLDPQALESCMCSDSFTSGMLGLLSNTGQEPNAETLCALYASNDCGSLLSFATQSDPSAGAYMHCACEVPDIGSLVAETTTALSETQVAAICQSNSCRSAFASSADGWMDCLCDVPQAGGLLENEVPTGATLDAICSSSTCMSMMRTQYPGDSTAHLECGCALPGYFDTDADAEVYQLMGLLKDMCKHTSCAPLASSYLGNLQGTCDDANAQSDCSAADVIDCGRRCTQCLLPNATYDADGGSCSTCYSCTPPSIPLSCLLDAAGAMTDTSAIFKTVTEFSATGDVSDFTEATRTSLAQAFADKMNVPVSTVMIIVTAGSVTITVEFTTDSAVANAALQSNALQTLNTMSQVNAVLASSNVQITATTDATITAAITVNEKAGDSDSNTGLIIGVVAGAAVLVILVAVVVMVRGKKSETETVGQTSCTASSDVKKEPPSATC
jgi:hypothetical protein